MDQDRDALIESIVNAQVEFAEAMARSRKLPILDTTLTMQQLKVLILLSFDNNRPSQDVAEELGVSLATATGIIDRLVARDLVIRAEDPRDRRVRRVRLTSAGRALIDDLSDTGISHLRAILKSLDTQSLKDYWRILGKLNAARHGSPPQR